MALSLFLRSSALRTPLSKGFSCQILRSSSICSSINNRQSCTPYLQNVQPSTKLLTPPAKTSPILAKYFAASKVVQSADGKGHDHVTIWKFERILSIALLPLIPAAFIAPNPVFDTLVAVGIVMHTHWGLEAIVVDYIRPILFGEIGPKIGMGLLYIFSAVTLAGCLNLIFNDVGLANAFREIWKL